MPYKHTLIFKSSAQRHEAMLALHRSIGFPMERSLIGDDRVSPRGEHKYEFETPFPLTERETALVKMQRPLRITQNQAVKEGWLR